ncbi:MAG: hypothetical protein HFE81_03520 [Bacilli bacterium]|nr:hypothetical protein [Bacilli bacterium]
MNILITIGIIFLFLLTFLIGCILGSFYLILFKKNIEIFNQENNETKQKDYEEEIISIKNEIFAINNKLSTSATNNEQIINEWLNGGEYNE